jgi:integrase
MEGQMARSSRRNPDKRRIRQSATYSIPDMAQLFDKAESTVIEWIAKGLPVIDNLEPKLVYGWVLKQWHQAWWEARKTNCGPTGFYCNPCKSKRTPKPASVQIKNTNAGGVRATAACGICGATMFRGVKVDNIAALISANTIQSQEEGFIHSDNSPNIDLKSVESGNDPSLGQTGHDRADQVCSIRTPSNAGWPRNADNERIKRDYFTYLENACGLSKFSIEKRSIAILRYEAQNGWVSLINYSVQRALDYKAHLSTLDLQPPTRVAELRGLINFFSWMIESKSRSVKFSVLEVGYLRASLAERNAAQSTRMVLYPKVSEALIAFRAMPGRTHAEQRDRALFGLLASTGIRIGAVRTLRVKHLDLTRRLIHQDPLDVSTKFRKEIFTFILDVEDEFEQALVQWVRRLIDELQFGPDDPILPKTLLSENLKRSFEQRELSRVPYDTTQMLANIIKKTFTSAGLPPFSPHRFRNMLVHEIYARELSPSQLRAWSQNLGHTTPKTSILAYGKLTVEEQEAIIRKGSKGQTNKPVTQADFQNLKDAILKKDEAPDEEA